VMHRTAVLLAVRAEPVDVGRVLLGILTVLPAGLPALGHLAVGGMGGAELAVRALAGDKFVGHRVRVTTLDVDVANASEAAHVCRRARVWGR